MKIDDAIKELRKSDKKKFVQSVDLVINLQKIDPRKETINTFVIVPNPAPRRICAFLSKKMPGVDTITKEEFELYKDATTIKKLADRYDFFIASAPLMGLIATKFGRYLGPLGKMPTPQGGVIMQESEDTVKAMIKKMSSSLKVRVKEKSLKLAIGKEDLSDAQIKENAESVIKAVTAILPQNRDNIKNVLIKLTMGKPIALDK
jgi:large subunit ribosomal protein L1